MLAGWATRRGCLGRQIHGLSALPVGRHGATSRLDAREACVPAVAVATMDRASRGQAMGDRIDPAEVYFEITFIGASARVVAIDAVTGIEVTVIGPARAARTYLERLALAKLARAMRARHN